MPPVTWNQAILDIYSLSPLGSHGTADVSSAVTLTPPAGATTLWMQCATQNVRYTLDGSTPGSALGFVLLAGQNPIVIPVSGGAVVKVVEESATADFQYLWGG